MRVIKSTLLLLFTCLAVLSCTNEPLEGTFTDEIGTGGSSGSGGSGSESFFAKVDGVEFVESIISEIEAGGLLSISAVTTSGSAIAIAFPNDITSGTYDVDLVSYVGQYINASVDPPIVTAADSGSIEITAHDTTARTISGTFTFIATPIGDTTPEYNITEGSFNVSY